MFEVKLFHVLINELYVVVFFFSFFTIQLCLVQV